MTTPETPAGTPSAILLATDFSARCDRAFARAVALATAWKCRLVVVHALEAPSALEGSLARLPSWRRAADPRDVAQQEIFADLGVSDVPAKVVVRPGAPADVILDVAREEGCGLIVAAVARDELFGRFDLGDTVTSLLRAAPVPVLVVKTRCRHPYAHIVAATDFSATARHALDVALRLFPDQTPEIFHAYDTPRLHLTSDTESYDDGYRQMAQAEFDAFLAGIPALAQRPDRPTTFIERGRPDVLLSDLARERGVDLVVLGTHGRSGIAEVFLGSVAKLILASLPCDALVVRPQEG